MRTQACICIMHSGYKYTLQFFFHAGLMPLHATINWIYAIEKSLDQYSSYTHEQHCTTNSNYSIAAIVYIITKQTWYQFLWKHVRVIGILFVITFLFLYYFKFQCILLFIRHLYWIHTRVIFSIVHVRKYNGRFKYVMRVLLRIQKAKATLLFLKCINIEIKCALS